MKSRIPLETFLGISKSLPSTIGERSVFDRGLGYSIGLLDIDEGFPHDTTIDFRHWMINLMQFKGMLGK
jgi:hypothetical protein